MTMESKRAIISRLQFDLPNTLWEELEPAPPKDWRPACWTGELEYDANNCIDPWIEDDEVTEPCLSCPYHKLE